MQNFKIINLEYLKNHSQGSRDIEKKMLSIYLKEIPEAIKKLNAGLDEGNWYKIGRAAYRAKNILPTIGMNEAANGLIEIDTLCRKSENLERVKELVCSFELTGQASIAEINRALEDYKDD